MSITPILPNRITNNSNLVNFQARRTQDEMVPYDRPQKSSNLRKVPVIVLIAMSPLTTANTRATENSAPEKAPIEMVQQQKRTRITTLLKKQAIESGYEHMQFLQIDSDKNLNNVESMGANYHYNSEGGYQGIMNMVIKIISSTPNKDGRYTILYNEITDDGEIEKPRICSIRKAFGDYLIRFANSKANNAAITIDKTNYLNRTMHNNVPKIEDEVTILYDPYSKETFKIPRQN